MHRSLTLVNKVSRALIKCNNVSKFNSNLFLTKSFTSESPKKEESTRKLTKTELDILTRMALKLDRTGILEQPGETQQKLEDASIDHKTIYNMKETKGIRFYVRCGDDVWIDQSASLLGNIKIWQHASFWYGSIVRGDKAGIKIGSFTNIQDNAIITDVERLSEVHDGSTVIGHFVTIGHNAILKGTTVGSNVIVGMGSKLLPGSYMESESMLAAGSVLLPGQRVKTGELWKGSPAKFARKLDLEEKRLIKISAMKYYYESLRHKKFSDFSHTETLTTIKKGFDMEEF